jgi:hypothetical protein
MLGFGDFWVALAFISSIASMLLCVIYGLIHWNQDDTFPEAHHPAEENRDFEEEI